MSPWRTRRTHRANNPLLSPTFGMLNSNTGKKQVPIWFQLLGSKIHRVAKCPLLFIHFSVLLFYVFIYIGFFSPFSCRQKFLLAGGSRLGRSMCLLQPRHHGSAKSPRRESRTSDSGGSETPAAGGSGDGSSAAPLLPGGSSTAPVGLRFSRPRVFLAVKETRVVFFLNGKN